MFARAQLTISYDIRYLQTAHPFVGANRIRSDEGLTLETSAFETLYGGQFTLSTQLIKSNHLVILPPTQHHSFFRNLPPLFIYEMANEERGLNFNFIALKVAQNDIKVTMKLLSSAFESAALVVTDYIPFHKQLCISRFVNFLNRASNFQIYRFRVFCDEMRSYCSVLLQVQSSEIQSSAFNCYGSEAENYQSQRLVPWRGNLLCFRTSRGKIISFISRFLAGRISLPVFL